MAGARPKPTALKELAGNPGKRPLNDQEPRPQSGAPEKPKGMSLAANREWDRIVPELERIGVLAVTDGKALAGYCDAFAHVEMARKEIKRLGLIVEEPVLNKEGELIATKYKANPAVTIYNTFAKLMKSFLIEFGLTPASRTKLKVERPKEADPFEEAMAKRTPVPATQAGQPTHFDIGKAVQDADVSFDA